MMTWLFVLFNLLLLVACVRWLYIRTGLGEKWTFGIGLSLRLACGIGIGILYQNYYGIRGDTFGFFEDSVKLTSLGLSDPVGYLRFIFIEPFPIGLQYEEPRAAFFVEILSALNFITGSSYWVSSLWLSLISFFCSWRLAQKIRQVIPDSKWPAYIGLLFFPSVVFWSSGIVKESLAFASICLLVNHFLSVMYGKKLKWFHYLEIIVVAYVLLNLKYYWAAVLVPALLTSLLLKWIIRDRVSNVWQLAIIWLAAFGVLCAFASFTHPNFYFERFLYVIKSNHDQFVRISSPGRVIVYDNLDESWGSVLRNAPWALFSGLFRPAVTNIHGFTSAIAANENLLLLLWTLDRMMKLKVPDKDNRLIVMSTIVYVTVLCVFLALSTPNFGTLSRYRIGFLPFFVILLTTGSPMMKFSSSAKNDQQKK